MNAATILRHARVAVSAGAAPAPRDVVIDGDKIVWVGAPGAGDARFPHAESIDLAGAVVYPGFVDSHGHMAELGKGLESADLRGLRSPEACARKMRAQIAPSAAELASQNVWLEGDGWDQNLWTPKEFPDAAVLDAEIPSRPAFARRIDGHAVWLNSAAMRAGGIDASTSDPPGGRIVRRKDGTPSGVFIDNAMDLALRARPVPAREDLRRYFARALASCARVGLTGVGDASAYGETEIGVLREMADRGELPIRVYATIGPDAPGFDAMIAAGPVSHGMLTVRAVKVFADGALGSRGAELLAPYSDDPGNRGLAVTPKTRIESIAERCFRAGFQVWVHAIGDRANRDVLDAYSAAERAVRPRDPRPRIEHAQVVAVEDRPRFAALGVIASIQPAFATSDMPWAQARLSAARVGESYAWRSLEKAGARLTGGSDCPIESNDPRLGIYAAVAREDLDGRPPGGWRPEEDLSRTDAIALYTSGAAYAMFAEERRGTVAEGRDADLTVLDRDVAACPVSEIPKARVRMTIAAGKVVFRQP